MPLNQNNSIDLGYPFNIKHFLSNLKQYYKAGFWYWDSESNKIHLGKKTIAGLGIADPTDKMELDDFLDLIHKDDKKVLVKMFLRLRDNTAHYQEVDFRIKVQNEWHWKRIIAFAAKKQPSANKYYIIGQFKNIAPGNGTTNAPGEALSFERFARLLNKHQLALLEIDTNGVVLNWNKNSSRLFHFDALSTQSISIKESFGEEGWKKFQEWLVGSSIKPFTSSFKLFSGDECYLSWSKLIDDQQNSKTFIVAARDVSQLVELQNQNKRYEFQNQMLISFCNQIKGQFLPDEIFLLLGQTLEKVFPKSISMVFSYSNDDSFITIESILGMKSKTWDTFIDELGWNPVGRRFYIEKHYCPTKKSRIRGFHPKDSPPML